MIPITAIGPGAEVEANAITPVPPGFEALLGAATDAAPETDIETAGEPPADNFFEGWIEKLIARFGVVTQAGPAAPIVAPSPDGTPAVVASETAKLPQHRRFDDPEAPVPDDLEDAPLDWLPPAVPGLAAMSSALIVPTNIQGAHLLTRHPGGSRDPIVVEWVPASAGMTVGGDLSPGSGGPGADKLGDTTFSITQPLRTTDLAGPASATDKFVRSDIGLEANIFKAATPALGGTGAASPLSKDGALVVQATSLRNTAGPLPLANATGQQAALPGKAPRPEPIPTSPQMAPAAAMAPTGSVAAVTATMASPIATQPFIPPATRATTRQPRDLREALSDPVPAASAIATPLFSATLAERTPPPRASTIDAVPAVDATVRAQGSSFDLATQSLGALHVALETSDAAMRVHVVAERSATASLIVGQGDRLQAAVETSGHRLGALSVDIRDGDAGRRPLHWQAPEPAAPRRAAPPAAVAARTPDRFA